MLCAVEATIIPKMIKEAPRIATYRRPMRSDMDPTKGQTAARASKLPSTNHVHLSAPPISRYIKGGMPPKKYSGIWEPVQRKAMAMRDMMRLKVICFCISSRHCMWTGVGTVPEARGHDPYHHRKCAAHPPRSSPDVQGPSLWFGHCEYDCLYEWPSHPPQVLLIYQRRPCCCPFSTGVIKSSSGEVDSKSQRPSAPNHSSRRHSIKS